MKPNTPSLRPKYWERYKLDQLNADEWEALCDGCGKCCLNKLEDEETGQVVLTRIACRLLDDATCQCSQYDIRRTLVPECIHLTPTTIPKHAYWLPATCAYKRLWQGKDLPAWHPLVSGNSNAAHEVGISVRGQTLSEMDVPLEEWEDHIIEELT